MSNENNKLNQSKNEEKKGVGMKSNLQLLFIISCVFLILFSNNIAYSIEKTNQGKWILLDDKLIANRCYANGQLLPDGKVIIFGGCGILRSYENSAEIYDPEQQKIIKTIQITDENIFATTAMFYTCRMKNGNIYSSFGTIYPNSTTEQSTVRIFNSKDYNFQNVKIPDSVSFPYWNHLIPLDNGNVLILNNSAHDDFVYNTEKNKFYSINSDGKNGPTSSTYIKLENGDIIFIRGNKFKENKTYIYSMKKNKIEQYYIDLPYINVQIDEDNYINFKNGYDFFAGNIYNIKENKLTPVKNIINRTIFGTGAYPVYVKLDNKNILILGLNADKQKIGTKFKYTSYIYDFKKNKFYQVPNPPFPIDLNTAIVHLNNGDILFAGGLSRNKIAIYKYK